MLKELMKKERLTQKEIAAYIGVSQPLISAWVNRKAKPNIDDAIKLANLLKVAVEKIINYFAA